MPNKAVWFGIGAGVGALVTGAGIWGYNKLTSGNSSEDKNDNDSSDDNNDKSYDD